jgi:hypothetical protein
VLGSEFVHLLAGLGLATSSGLNPWIPSLGLAVAIRTDLIQPVSGMDWLGSNYAIGAFLVLLIADFVGDKVPALDSAVHAVGVVVHPVVGGALVAAQATLLSDVHPALAWIAGGAVGGTIHAARATLRPAVTVSTAGVGNSIVSLIEDAVSLVLAVMAIVVPILGFMAAIAIVVMIVRRIRRRRDEPAIEPSSPRPQRWSGP